MEQSDQQFLDELHKTRQKLLKALGQAEKIEAVCSSPEWDFYIGWIEASLQKFTNRISSQDFINDHNGYIYTLGQINAIKTVIDGIESFKKAGERSAKKLNEVNQQISEVQ